MNFGLVGFLENFQTFVVLIIEGTVSLRVRKRRGRGKMGGVNITDDSMLS